MFESYLEELGPQLAEKSIDIALSTLHVLLILIAAYIIIKLLRIALNKLETPLTHATERTETVPGAAGKRIKTLMGVLHTIAVTLIWFFAALISLSQIGVNIGPILAGAGVVGLAVGFGAQNLVRDLVTGFFLILENQVRVGDIAVINGTGGLVEAVTFRTIVLRDLEAVVHIFPNGTINTLSNRTKDWSAYVIDVGVAYKEDTDQVTDVMRRVADEMQGDPKFGSVMLAPMEIFGVDDYGDSAVTIKGRFRTQPLQQFNIGREYRRRLKKAFDAQGIEIPFPHRTLYMGEASPPFQFAVDGASKATEVRN